MSTFVEALVEFIKSDPTVFDHQIKNEWYRVLTGKEADGVKLQVGQNRTSDGEVDNYEIGLYRTNTDDDWNKRVYRAKVCSDGVYDKWAETKISEDEALQILDKYREAIESQTITI